MSKHGHLFSKKAEIARIMDNDAYDAAHPTPILMKPILPPRLVVEPIRHLNPALLGTKAERDAFADEMLARDREYQEAMSKIQFPNNQTKHVHGNLENNP